jgi:hypothetical protein
MSRQALKNKMSRRPESADDHKRPRAPKRFPLLVGLGPSAAYIAWIVLGHQHSLPWKLTSLLFAPFAFALGYFPASTLVTATINAASEAEAAAKRSRKPVRWPQRSERATRALPQRSEPTRGAANPQESARQPLQDLSH